ncbi:tetratricopeptide repeat protein [Mesorhizobium carmichaelinearum]|uniref:tetratricopeptide repeat protein n=1 Tax=Mesorhizobium carmichaelinearum TaxID=1208188 RepID=UPI00117CC9C8|nr:tetratricopeptide repeat protein [Mesorhizobium carmichaelinearum]
MPRDQQGLLVTGSPASIAALDTAVTDYFAWRGDPVAVLQDATQHDPAFTLGHTALAALFALNGLRGDNPAVVSAISAAEASIDGATSRERGHLAAAKAWAAGEIIAATDIWEGILVDHPTDALALRFAHDSYFYLGHSASIRDSVARVLPKWDSSNANYGFVLGQYAFGLEETGELRRAEEFGRRAIAKNAEDAWAVHAVAHVLETESRQREGIEFLKGSRPAWGKAHALSVHNGWHLALYLIEEGRFAEVLADYDRFIRPKLAADSLLDLVDASALLWRVELAGGDVGDRWSAVADQWLTHIDDHVLVFNDLHIALALSRAGRRDGLDRLLHSLDSYAAHGKGDNREITADVGRRIVDAAVAFADGDYARVVELILPVRYKVIRIGGSHAQRDLITQTLIAAAERSGNFNLARALLAERLAVRPTERTRQAYIRAEASAAAHQRIERRSDHLGGAQSAR